MSGSGSRSQSGEHHLNRFPETHWSLVLAAIDPESPEGKTALGELYLTYRYPLYAFIRRSGYSAADAEDMVQQFFARIVEGNSLANLRREGGRFRSFLLTALKYFLADERKRANAQKRGGGQELLSLDLTDEEGRYQLEPADPAAPGPLFDQRWATTLLAHVSHRLRMEYVASNKVELFDELRPFLGGKDYGNEYVAIAQRHGITENVVKVAVHRMRKRYGAILREEVARTVSHPEDVQEEIRYLMSVVGGKP